jgi:hypothetical protein
MAPFNLLGYQANNLLPWSLSAYYNGFRVSVVAEKGLQLIFWITLPFTGAFQRRWALEWLQALRQRPLDLLRIRLNRGG